MILIQSVTNKRLIYTTLIINLFLSNTCADFAMGQILNQFTTLYVDYLTTLRTIAIERPTKAINRNVQEATANQISNEDK